MIPVSVDISDTIETYVVIYVEQSSQVLNEKKIRSLTFPDVVVHVQAQGEADYNVNIPTR